MNYNQQYQDQVSTKVHQNHDNNNYSHAPGRFMTPETCEAILTAYQENINDTMPGAVAHMIEDAFKHGLEADEIVMAIEETGFAPKPSPWYLRKILAHWVTHGVTVSKLRHEIKANKGLPWWR